MSTKSDSAEIAVLQSQMEEVKSSLTDIKSSMLRIEALLPNYLTRAEYSDRHETLVAKVELLSDRMTTIEGQSKGRSLSWGYLAGGVTIIIAVLALLLNAVRLIGH